MFKCSEILKNKSPMSRTLVYPSVNWGHWCQWSQMKPKVYFLFLQKILVRSDGTRFSWDPIYNQVRKAFQIKLYVTLFWSAHRRNRRKIFSCFCNSGEALEKYIHIWFPWMSTPKIMVLFLSSTFQINISLHWSFNCYWSPFLAEHNRWAQTV